MAKKNDLTVTGAKVEPVALLELTDAEQGLADFLEVDMRASVDTQIARLKVDARTTLETALRMGLRFLAINAACAHGEFEGRIAETGVGRRDVFACMAAARAYAAEGDARRREALLSMGKTKGMALLATKPEVREQIMSSPDLMAEALEGTKREFEAQVKALSEKVKTLENAAQAQMSRHEVDLQSHIITPDVPPQVSDIRRETAALYKQASLAVQSLANLAQPMMELHHIQKAQPWVRPGAVQAYTAMQSLHAELAVQMAVWRDAFGLDDVQGLPPITDHAFYQPEEAALVATHFAAMTDTHAKEGIKRANQRANELAGKRGAKRKDV